MFFHNIDVTLVLVMNKMETPKINVPNLVTFLIGHLQFSGVWLGMDLRTNTKKTCTLKKLDYVLKICYPFKAHLST
jgi:hypothetical protein